MEEAPVSKAKAFQRKARQLGYGDLHLTPDYWLHPLELPSTSPNASMRIVTASPQDSPTGNVGGSTMQVYSSTLLASMSPGSLRGQLSWGTLGKDKSLTGCSLPSLTSTAAAAKGASPYLEAPPPPRPWSPSQGQPSTKPSTAVQSPQSLPAIGTAVAAAAAEESAQGLVSGGSGAEGGTWPPGSPSGGGWGGNNSGGAAVAAWNGGSRGPSAPGSPMATGNSWSLLAGPRRSSGDAGAPFSPFLAPPEVLVTSAGDVRGDPWGLEASGRQRKDWNSDTHTASVTPTFEQAVQQWQAQVLAGAFAPKPMAPALSSSASRTTFRNHHLKVPATPAPSSSPPRTRAGGRNNTTSGRSPTSATTSSSKWASQPVMFFGTGPAAIAALEDIVRKSLVQKPHLTLLQLQSAVATLSELATEEQLAAVAILLRGGFWMAALQVQYADTSLLYEVLVEVRGLLEAGLSAAAAADQAAAALGSWQWHPIDRAMFVKAFKHVPLVQQYVQLRRQLASLGKKRAAATAAVLEQEMLLQMLDYYLENLEIVAAADLAGGLDADDVQLQVAEASSGGAQVGAEYVSGERDVGYETLAVTAESEQLEQEQQEYEEQDSVAADIAAVTQQQALRQQQSEVVASANRSMSQAQQQQEEEEEQQEHVLSQQEHVLSQQEKEMLDGKATYLQLLQSKDVREQQQPKQQKQQSQQPKQQKKQQGSPVKVSKETRQQQQPKQPKEQPKQQQPKQQQPKQPPPKQHKEQQKKPQAKQQQEHQAPHPQLQQQVQHNEHNPQQPHTQGAQSHQQQREQKEQQKEMPHQQLPPQQPHQESHQTQQQQTQPGQHQQQRVMSTVDQQEQLPQRPQQTQQQQGLAPQHQEHQPHEPQTQQQPHGQHPHEQQQQQPLGQHESSYGSVGILTEEDTLASLPDMEAAAANVNSRRKYISNEAPAAAEDSVVYSDIDEAAAAVEGSGKKQAEGLPPATHVGGDSVQNKQHTVEPVAMDSAAASQLAAASSRLTSAAAAAPAAHIGSCPSSVSMAPAGRSRPASAATSAAAAPLAAAGAATVALPLRPSSRPSSASLAAAAAAAAGLQLHTSSRPTSANLAAAVAAAAAGLPAPPSSRPTSAGLAAAAGVLPVRISSRPSSAAARRPSSLGGSLLQEDPAAAAGLQWFRADCAEQRKEVEERCNAAADAPEVSPSEGFAGAVDAPEGSAGEGVAAEATSSAAVADAVQLESEASGPVAAPAAPAAPAAATAQGGAVAGEGSGGAAAAAAGEAGKGEAAGSQQPAAPVTAGAAAMAAEPQQQQAAAAAAGAAPSTSHRSSRSTSSGGRQVLQQGAETDQQALASSLAQFQQQLQDTASMAGLLLHQQASCRSSRASSRANSRPVSAAMGQRGTMGVQRSPSGNSSIHQLLQPPPPQGNPGSRPPSALAKKLSGELRSAAQSRRASNSGEGLAAETHSRHSLNSGGTDAAVAPARRTSSSGGKAQAIARLPHRASNTGSAIGSTIGSTLCNTPGRNRVSAEWLPTNSGSGAQPKNYQDVWTLLANNKAQVMAALEELDQPPTKEEIEAYARYLGMDPVQDEALLYIAEWALTAPLPPGWTAHLDVAGNEYFHNLKSGVSSYEHPLDRHYKAYAEQKRKELHQWLSKV